MLNLGKSRIPPQLLFLLCETEYYGFVDSFKKHSWLSFPCMFGVPKAEASIPSHWDEQSSVSSDNSESCILYLTCGTHSCSWLAEVSLEQTQTFVELAPYKYTS